MRIIRYFFVIAALSVACAWGMFVFLLHSKTVDFSRLTHYDPGRPTILLDDEGNEWARFQYDKREFIGIDKMPEHVIHAFIAAEDHKFFTHSGISYKGIVRSILVNLYHRRYVQGASTITQQLVRHLFFDLKKTFKRKLLEQFYTVLIERQFTKHQILEVYLNHICFGHGIYGVEAACQRFWDKSVTDISIDQAATLAGIIQNPVRRSPINHPLSAQQRRNTVLRSMYRLSLITDIQYAQAIAKSVSARDQDAQTIAPHLKEEIRQFLEERFGRTALYEGGLTVQTTMNKKTQALAQRYFTKQFEELRKKVQKDVDGALVSIDPQSGGVKALVGGVDFGRSKWNRVLQARRQMGSTFKPIVYAAAIEQGKTFADTEMDEAFTREDHNKLWQPKNVTRRFDGQMTLAYALSHSNNIVTIKTLLDVGCERIAELGRKCRLKNVPVYPSIALGCIDATPFENVAVFNIFANHGVYVEPHYISWVKDRWGKKIYRHQPVEERIFSTRVSDQVAKVLSIGMERKRRIYPRSWISCEGIGKTGTTNDCRTSWFVGSTPTLTTALYVGCDDNRSMGDRVYPTATIFPIWLRLNRDIDSSKKTFDFDPSLQELCIHSKTGSTTIDPDNPEAYTILV
ncbi:PBP1A family penicillin-binding protein [Candidatus Babeliales bacterium]|nr:PBP1A family penicillin-binding protein [Candidatus Babeliales bacterium]